MTVQLSTLYTDRRCHSVQRHRWENRQTDRQMTVSCQWYCHLSVRLSAPQSVSLCTKLILLRKQYGVRQWRPQTMTATKLTMTATAMTATNHDHELPWRPQPWRPQPWRPQTMTATSFDHDGHNHDGHKLWQWRPQLPSLLWPSLVMVCGRHGIGSGVRSAKTC